MRSPLNSFPDGQDFYPIEKLEIPSEHRVLVLAPHPDDFDAIAVTLHFLLSNGNPIHLRVLTSGASGVEPGFCASGDWETRSEVREHEQRRSCRFFRLPERNFQFLRLPEDRFGHLVADEDSLARVRECLDECVPDLVFLPHGNDTNSDHRRTYHMMRQIAASAEMTFSAFLARDPKTIEMRDEVVTFFGKDGADWKSELLRLHETQQQRNLNVRGYGLDERILRLNQKTAARVRDRHFAGRKPTPGELFAESFEVELWVDGQASTLSPRAR